MGDVVIPDDWDGEYCCYSVRWPNSFRWLAVLNGLIDLAGSGYYWNEETGDVTETIEIVRETFDYNFKNYGVIMACTDDIANALLEIANALREQSTNSCCGGIGGTNGGSGGAGMEPTTPSETVDDEDSHEGPPPDGYDSWEEFDELKCNWATYVVNQMIVDVATMSVVTIGTSSATGLATILVTLLVTPVGWVILLEIAVIMIAATLEAGFYSWITSNLEDNFNDYVCALVEGTTVDGSISSFVDTANTLIDDDTNFNSLTGYWAKQILKGLASIDSINRLYERQPFEPPSAECDCETPTTGYEVLRGVELSEHPSNPFLIEAIDDPDGGAVAQCGSDAQVIRFTFDVPVTITEIVIGGSGLCGACGSLYLYNYYSNTDFTTLIQSTNARPQDDFPVPNVRAMNMYLDCDGETPNATVSYTID